MHAVVCRLVPCLGAQFSDTKVDIPSKPRTVRGFLYIPTGGPLLAESTSSRDFPEWLQCAEFRLFSRNRERLLGAGSRN